jgi:ribulose-phosphate 3-epimerase
MVKALRPHTKLPFDCHLMIENPDDFIPDFLAAGADLITVHVEACPHLHRTVNLIRKGGAKAGVALNPHTPLPHADVIAEEADVLLLMTVNPGYGGQPFIRTVLPKFTEAARNRAQRGLSYEIEADGGVNLETAPELAKAGADILVAGNAVYNHKPAAENMRALREAITRALAA